GPVPSAVFHVTTASSEALGFGQVAASVTSQPAGGSCGVVYSTARSAAGNSSPACRTPSLAPGQSVQYTIAVTPRQSPGPLDVGLTLKNPDRNYDAVETLRPNLVDANGANNTSSATINYVLNDVSISGSVPATRGIGEATPYTVTVKNNGPGPVPSAVFHVTTASSEAVGLGQVEASVM